MIKNNRNSSLKGIKIFFISFLSCVLLGTFFGYIGKQVCDFYQTRELKELHKVWTDVLPSYYCNIRLGFFFSVLIMIIGLMILGILKKISKWWAFDFFLSLIIIILVVILLSSITYNI